MNDKMVDHPGHYEKGNGHKECIELLEVLTRGYSGIAAGCVMQAKYLYRAGSKNEEGLTIEQKFVQDFKKCSWYLKYFRTSAKRFTTMGIGTLPTGFRCEVMKTKEEIDELVYEFTFDKSDEVKKVYSVLLPKLANLHSFEDIDDCIYRLDHLVFELETKAA